MIVGAQIVAQRPQMIIRTGRSIEVRAPMNDLHTMTFKILYQILNLLGSHVISTRQE